MVPTHIIVHLFTNTLLSSIRKDKDSTVFFGFVASLCGNVLPRHVLHLVGSINVWDHMVRCGRVFELLNETSSENCKTCIARYASKVSLLTRRPVA